jgi:hypothetical protein
MEVGMNRLSRAAVLLALASFPAACASAGEAGGSDSPDAERVFVSVENSARADLEVSVIGYGQTIRLGRVQLGDQRQFRVPSAFLRTPPYSFSVEVVARDGSGAYTTPVLLVRRGQNVSVDASPTLSSSRFEVR